MRNLNVEKNDAGQRLDKFLTKAVRGLPKSLMYKFIRKKRIKVNGKRSEEGYMLCENDVVNLYIREEFFSSPERDNTVKTLGSVKHGLSIVYEDKNIILLNKRPGELVHEDAAGTDNTLSLRLKAYLYQKGEYDPLSELSFAPALCNRLDRNTCGIVIAAKNAETLRIINEKIRKREISRIYIAAVHGLFEKKTGVLEAWLFKDAKANVVDISDVKKPGYREIITKYRVIRSAGDGSLLEISLVTGRTHQIRAQMAHIGHPLYGEGKYAKNRDDRAKGYAYQTLCAYRVRFDFNKEGPLGYLSGREFSIGEDEIWFLKDFT